MSQPLRFRDVRRSQSANMQTMLVTADVSSPRKSISVNLEQSENSPCTLVRREVSTLSRPCMDSSEEKPMNQYAIDNG